MSDNPAPIKTDTSEHLSLKVVGSDQNEVFFKIKRTTQLRKLMEAYCERQGKSMGSVRFLYDGNRLRPVNTPSEVSDEHCGYCGRWMAD
jgi:small ubiquitin-related modifier